MNTTFRITELVGGGITNDGLAFRVYLDPKTQVYLKAIDWELLYRQAEGSTLDKEIRRAEIIARLQRLEAALVEMYTERNRKITAARMKKKRRS